MNVIDTNEREENAEDAEALLVALDPKRIRVFSYFSLTTAFPIGTVGWLRIA